MVRRRLGDGIGEYCIVEGGEKAEKVTSGRMKEVEWMPSGIVAEA